jgi:hypothetical protein
MYQTHILTPNGHSIPRTRFTAISFWDILDYMELREEEVEAISDFGLSELQWSAVEHPLISNTLALECIVTGLEAYYDELQMDVDEYGQPSRSLPARLYTRKDITEMFWAVVHKEDYINLEGNG